MLRWLDRAWLAVIALAAVFIGTLWLLLNIERMGLRVTTALIAMALVARITHRPRKTA